MYQSGDLKGSGDLNQCVQGLPWNKGSVVICEGCRVQPDVPSRWKGTYWKVLQCASFCAWKGIQQRRTWEWEIWIDAGIYFAGEQLWLSDLSTTYIKLSKGSIHEAYAAFGDTGNGGFHHPTSPWPTCDWLSFSQHPHETRPTKIVT